MRYAFIFPGQGSQTIGMGKEIYENFKLAKELLHDASDYCGINFYKLLFTQNDDINKTEFTQPAIVLNSLMCYLAFKTKFDVSPQFLLGHSLGEFSALAVAGAMSFLDAIKIVNLRGQFMQESCSGKNAAMMVILGLKDEVVEDICLNLSKNKAQIWPANYNSDGQIVLAGNKEDLIKYENEFKNAGAKRCMLLNISVASHCPMLDYASSKLNSNLTSFLKDDFMPVVSNATAQKYQTKSEALVLLKEQLVKPVLYKQSILKYSNEVDCFIEFGSTILKNLNKKNTDKPTICITDLNSIDNFNKDSL